MEEAVVLGSVVVNQAVPALRRRKLLWIQPLDTSGEPSGQPLAAVDVTQSGPGTRVIFVRSREAAAALDDPFCPVDAAITGIVDESRWFPPPPPGTPPSQRGRQ
jgi:ethanolamine utilization protein EutN